jgi:hypothetical protein
MMCGYCQPARSINLTASLLLTPKVLKFKASDLNSPNDAIVGDAATP